MLRTLKMVSNPVFPTKKENKASTKVEALLFNE